MSSARFGYRTVTPETPWFETVTTHEGKVWGRVFKDGVLPDGWQPNWSGLQVATASQKTGPSWLQGAQPMTSTPEPAAPKKKGRAA